MLFNSVRYLLFFPIAVLFYFNLPHKVRWIWLLIISYYFYMCWNPQYALLLGTTTVITYLSGLLLECSKKIHDTKKRIFHMCLWVFISFTSNLAILFFFKYFDFAFVNMNRVLSVFGVSLIQPGFDILLPVGISFYTFQALSYTMDVYRGDIYAEKNLAKYALFVSFFPQLVAGPIERSKNLLVQINEYHSFDYNRVRSGLILMLWGFFQKMAIADRAAIIVNQVYNNYTDYSGFEILVATFLFSLQIYCDFGGYSNIAIGSARIMGFRLMKNFNTPYFANSIQDFWRRWHISLSTWFRDYLYIPLGGNRCSKTRKYFNIMVTFLTSGLWHGASWNYIIWGGLHGFYQVFGAICKPIKEKLLAFFHVRTETFSYRTLQQLTTFMLVSFAWIFFRAPGGRAALSIIQRLFNSFNLWSLLDGSIFLIGLSTIGWIFLILSILILFVGSVLQQKGKLYHLFIKQNLWFRWATYFTLTSIVLFMFICQNGGYGDAPQFIYFQF